MDDAQVRHDRIGRWGEAVEIEENSLAHLGAGGVERHHLGDRAVGVMARREEGRHVESGDRGEGPQERRAVVARRLAPGEDDVADVADRLLTVAEQHAVEEGRERLRIEGARAAGDHQGVLGAALCRAQGDAAELEHGEQVRVRELVLQAHADDMKIDERRVALEGHERQPARAQQRLHVGPGRIDALRRDVGSPVEDIVEDLETQVGLRDLVDLGKG